MRTLELLIGPTASGKSAAALALARRHRAEILSVDSMKIYRRLEIGVAKPSPQERAEVRHHLIDWKEPWAHCSVAEWLREAERVAGDVEARGIRLIAEGGTPMYLTALREGLFEGPGRDPDIRARLETEAEAHGIERLYARLKETDPAAAAKILPGDLRRIVRALEVFELTGEPISAQQKQWGRPRDDLSVRTAGLRLERETLYRRIDERVEAMLAAGWLGECCALLELDRERELSKEAKQAIGYRTLFAHLRGEIGYADAVQRIKFDTHHFARRQLMWFRRFEDVAWVDLRGDESVEEIAERVEGAWISSG